MRTMLEFLRLHPHIAAQYESYLASLPTPHNADAKGQPWLPQGQSLPVEEYMASLPKGPEGPSIPREEYMEGVRIGNYALHEGPRPPARGKLLSISDAFRYLKDNKEARDIVHDEFFCQVTKVEARVLGNLVDGCWILNACVNVHRNSKGTLVKRVQIRHLAKSMPAAQLAYFLTFGEVPDKNLYNNCGNERCVKPEHHNLGRKGLLKVHVSFQPTKAEQTRKNMEAIVRFLQEQPEVGATGVQFQTRFVFSREMTLEEYTAALEMAHDNEIVYFRRADGRVYLPGYPSESRRAAAEQALRGADSLMTVETPTDSWRHD